MTKRSRKQRTTFSCGHRGYGKECQTCKQVAEGKLVFVDGKYYKPEEVP